jgi:hypothetical protein
LVGLDRFLRTDQRDVGCGEAMRLLHADADLVAHGDDATQGFPATPRSCARAALLGRLRRTAGRATRHP